MSSDSACMSDTLRILHLPPQLSNERRNDLFQKYGAIKTRTLRPSGKYTVTFAQFPSQQAALEAFLRLHQLNVKGQCLTVEFAKKSITSESTDSKAEDEKSCSDETEKGQTNRSHFQAFVQKLNSWTMNQVFTQPPPPNIRYKYVPPTKGTLMRIAIQLLKEPAFYTQVLHLMNRMNLPPPFEELESEFPLLKEAYDIDKYKDIFGKQTSLDNEKEDSSDKETEEEESEMESEEEDPNKHLEVVSVKRKRAQSIKRLKIPKFVNPAKQITSQPSAQKVVKPEDMFETVQCAKTKNMKIDLKKVDKLLDTSERTEKTDSESTADGGFGLMFPASRNTEETENSKDTDQVEQDVITSEELANNRISVNDQRVLPVFKNYHPGKPTNRLYIKNLAKQVEKKDLDYIYRKYILSGAEDVEQEYDIRLMQEGRMKGQAFVTLQNVTQAQLALDETNGYILKDKPMVVQFAKAAKN